MYAVFPLVGVGTWGAHVGEQPLNMPFYSVFFLLLSLLFHTQKLWQNDINRNKADFSLPNSFSYCLLMISDCVVILVEYSSRALTMGFEVRLELLSPVLTFHYMHFCFWKKTVFYSSRALNLKGGIKEK